MPQQLGAPGVYIEEVPSGRRVIKSVGTNIAAFIDYFTEGPMNEAVQIFGTSDFERIYGGYNADSEASYAIPQFFLNGGTSAYVIRVADASDGSNPLGTARVVLRASDASTPVLQVDAANPGEWGNTLRVDIDHDVSDPAATPARFNMRVTRYASTAPTAQPVSAETYLELSLDPVDSRYAPTVVNDGSNLVVITHLNAPTSTDLPAPTGTTGSDISALDTVAEFDPIIGTGFDMAILDAGGTTLTSASVSLSWTAGDVDTKEKLRAQVEKAIRQADPINPSFSKASVGLSGGRLRVRSGKGGTTYDPVERVQISDDGSGGAALVGLLTGGVEIENVQEYVVGRANAAGNVAALEVGGAGSDVGANGLPPTAADIIGSAAVEPPTGMFALDRVDLFNILCIPRAAELATISDDSQMDAVISNALSYCEDRRAFMIIDIPSHINEMPEMKDWLDGNAQYRSRNAAVYFPRVRIPDPLDEFRLRAVGASGTMAGVYARIDNTRGVWKAPAGIEALLEGVSELDAPLTDGQNGVLNPLGINCLRTFPIYGSIAWGARTARGADAIASEWAYVPVRRLALMLEESLFRGTKWVVFEPNGETTWANIRLNIGAFMNGLFRQGAFAGATPKEAYYVKCDSETTTQNDIDQGIVNIEVGFAPLKPAEFVVIKFRQIVGEVEV